MEELIMNIMNERGMLSPINVVRVLERMGDLDDYIDMEDEELRYYIESAVSNVETDVSGHSYCLNIED